MSQTSVRTYYRIDIAGGWTDVPPLYFGTPGVVLTASLAKGITLDAALAQERAVAVAGEAPAPFSADANAPFACRAAQAVGEVFGPWPSVLIRVTPDLPGGAGLGSSGALLGGLVMLHHALRGVACSPLAAAVEARKIEVEKLGHAAGWQDPIAACLGGFLGQRFSRGEENILHLAMSEPFLKNLLTRSLVVVTGHNRVSGDVVGEVSRRYAEDHVPTHDAMQVIRDAVKACVHAVMNQDEAALVAGVKKNVSGQLALHPAIGHEVYDQMQTALGERLLVLKPLGAGGGGNAWVLLRSAQDVPAAQSALGAYTTFVPELADFRGQVDVQT